MPNMHHAIVLELGVRHQDGCQQEALRGACVANFELLSLQEKLKHEGKRRPDDEGFVIGVLWRCHSCMSSKG